MSAGGTVAVGGLIAFAIGVTTPGVGIMGIIIGVTLVSVGSIVAIITGGVLIAALVERGRIDERIRILSEPPQPLTSRVQPALPGVLLARF
jgi:hypothetical protein